MIDGYAEKGGHHLSINVFTKDASYVLRHPEKYPTSADHSRFWYAVKFNSRAAQDDVDSAASTTL